MAISHKQYKKATLVSVVAIIVLLCSGMSFLWYRDVSARAEADCITAFGHELEGMTISASQDQVEQASDAFRYVVIEEENKDQLTDLSWNAYDIIAYAEDGTVQRVDMDIEAANGLTQMKSSYSGMIPSHCRSQ